MHNAYMLRDNNNTINTNGFYYPEGLCSEFRYATHVIHINVICTQNVKKCASCMYSNHKWFGYLHRLHLDGYLRKKMCYEGL